MNCSIDGCERPARKRGWCESHYWNWRTKGDPISPRARREYGARLPIITTKGYRLIYKPDHPLANAGGQVLEHRAVAWDAGILTDPSMHVHHVNGDKLDNRPENLEATRPGEHGAHHAAQDGLVTNQYGKWPLRRASEMSHASSDASPSA